ncbi:MAG: hypothetical protein WC474_11960 [Hydrogenophilaceae bacterium]
MKTATVTLPILALLAALVAGCTSAPPDKRAVTGTKHYTEVVDGLYVVDFEVDTRYSSLDKSSCYAFLTGTLANNSDGKLSRRSAVEFFIYHGDALLFRDHSFLRADLAAGNRVQFDLLQSPLHKKQCPSYDRIEVALRKVPLN